MGVEEYVGFGASSVHNSDGFSRTANSINSVMEELECVVTNIHKYCAAVKRLGVKILWHTYEMSYGTYDESVSVRLIWKSGLKLKARLKRKAVPFYIKNRAGEFSRAVDLHTAEGIEALFDDNCQ